MKELSDTNSFWIVFPNDTKDKLYLDDPTDKLQKCGKTTSGKLKAHNVRTIRDLLALSEEDMTVLATTGIERQRIAVNALRKHKSRAEKEEVQQCDRPPKIDYRMAENPYEAKFGQDWENQIATSSHVKCISVAKLVDHIYKETKQIFQDTTCKDNWMFYHDALSLMTSKDCIEYMKEKGYYEQWIFCLSQICLKIMVT